MSLTAAVVALFYSFTVSVSVAGLGHRCHVCVADESVAEVERLFPGTTLVSCLLDTQIKECPDDYQSCLTQIKGRQVMRTCAQFAVDACRTANGVDYCYCTGELCNAPPRIITSDDEDLTEEGSGQLDVLPTSHTTNNRTIPTNSTNTASGPSLVTTLLLVQLTTCTISRTIPCG